MEKEVVEVDKVKNLAALDEIHATAKEKTDEVPEENSPYSIDQYGEWGRPATHWMW